MGIPFSFLGLPGVETFATDQVYNKYFSGDGGDKIKDFNGFHTAFIEFCKEINTALPGRHYTAPPQKDLRAFYDEIKNAPDKEKKERLLKYLKEKISEYKTNEKGMIITGMVAPPAAIALKKTGENTPQLKRFRLHLIPNVVFVPTCTLISLVAVRAFTIRSTTKKA